MGCATVNFSANYYTLPIPINGDSHFVAEIIGAIPVPAEYKITAIDGAMIRKQWHSVFSIQSSSFLKHSLNMCIKIITTNVSSY